MGARTTGRTGPRRWQDNLFAPVDIGALVYFRVVFGVLALLEILRYTVRGKLSQRWIEPEFHFKYTLLEWVPTPSGVWMYVLAGAVMVSAGGLAIGFCYRLSALIFAFGFTWFFLSEATQYLNHFYLLALLGWIAVVLPANRRFAVDAWLKPALRSDVVPAWTLWLIRAQVAIVYFYGGLAKINRDWLAGEPVRGWLGARAPGTALEGFLSSELAVGLVAYGGLLFDLAIVPLLLWSRTRWLAFGLVVFFHLSNNWLFNIGIFPWLGIALSALFFPARSLRRLIDYFAPEASPSPVRAAVETQGAFRYRGAVVAFLVVYLTWQMLLPLRHFVYEGNVSWTEEGHRFAWHMMLRSKVGEASFYARESETGEIVRLPVEQTLSTRQHRKMSCHPDLILQYAHFLGNKLRLQGRTNLQIHVIAPVSLNRRPPALLIDPAVDLLAVESGGRRQRWILPMENRVPVPDWASQSISEASVAAARNPEFSLFE